MIWNYKIKHWDECQEKTVKVRGHVSADSFEDAVKVVTDFYGADTIEKVQIEWNEDGEAGIIETSREVVE